MSNVAHPSKVEISPLVVDESHAPCRTLPESAGPGAGAHADSSWSGLSGERYRARWFRGEAKDATIARVQAEAAARALAACEAAVTP